MNWGETLQEWGGKALEAYLSPNPTNVQQPNPNGTITSYTEGQPVAAGGFMAGNGRWLLIGGGVLAGLAALYFIVKD